MRSILLLLLFSSPIFAQPTLDRASPAAISVNGGQITLQGSGLKQPLSLWSTSQSFTTFSNIASSSTTSATATIQFDHVPDQFVGIRVATSSGISNPLLVAIDDLPSITANGKNKSAKEAQTIEIPAAVEGAIEELTSNFYKFPARKGKTLLVDVIANRIGSRLDPLVRLLDASGKELVFCDDDPSIAPDSRFSYPMSSDGDYILEIRDAAYEGSREHRYRLRIKETDTTESPVPPARHYPATLPALTEQEPNDTPAAATPCTIPSQLQGTFSKPQDRDVFKFHAKKGEHLLIRSKTRSIGSPCDVSLRLARQDGSKLADSRTDTADEASLDASIPEDGAYLLIVEEITGQSGPAIFYQLDVRPFAGFALNSDTDKLDIPAGGQAEFKITAIRRDYKGPITLSLDSAPDFLHLVNDSIKEDKNDTQLKIKIDLTAPVGRGFSFHILGHAKIKDADYTQSVSTYPALRKLFPLMHYPPSQLDGEIGLGIKPPAPTTTTAPARQK